MTVLIFYVKEEEPFVKCGVHIILIETNDQECGNWKTWVWMWQSQEDQNKVSNNMMCHLYHILHVPVDTDMTSCHQKIVAINVLPW